MSRHRNVRLFHDDDIMNYDEVLSSSVDEDIPISPNTVEQYIYNTEKRKLHELSAFTSCNEESLYISSDDFPVYTNQSVDLPDSPGDISGRITCNQRAKDFSNSRLGNFDESIFVSEGVVDDSDCTKNGAFSNKSKSTLKELDFDLLDSLTGLNKKDINSESAHINNFSRKSASASSNIKTKLPLTRGNYLGSKLKNLSISGFCMGNTSRPIHLEIKKPSSLGILFSNTHASPHIKLDDVFEVFVSKLSFVLVRSRSSLCNYIFPVHRTDLPFFYFDVPEPTFFKQICPMSTCIKFFILPPPKQRNRITVSKLTNGNQQETFKDQFAQTLLTQKLITSQLNGSKNQVNTTLNKPIDRSSLLLEYKKSHANNSKEIINLIVLGHVDAGKSTLMGNLLFKLGYVSNKLLSKYEWESQKLGKSSFAYAWILDQTTEERSRGVTMDIAQTSFETKTKRVALMDAPGHKDFVPRVIGGLSQADIALLVINATKGEFETGVGVGGQTREHALLARLLGVSRIIITVNKMDTVNWDKSRYEAVQRQLNSLLKSMNFSSIIYCPVSGLYGTNLVNKSTISDAEPSDSDLHQWYDGPCLVDLIDSIPSPDRTVDGPFRFVVSDIFKPIGSGTPFVAGRVVCGAVSAGLNLSTSKVICQPSDLRACVKSIRSLCKAGSCDNENNVDIGSKLLDQVVKYAFSGDQVALMLSEVDPFLALAPGDLISDPDNPVPSVSRIKAKLLVFNVKQPITKGYPVIVYYNCTNVSANVTKLLSMTHRENKIEKTVYKPRCIFGHCTTDVELTFESPICMELYENCKPLGRFLLRVGGDSVAGGTVTSVSCGPLLFILPPKKNRFVDL